MEAFANAGMEKDFTCVGVPDDFLPFGSASDVMSAVGMDPESVLERILAVIDRR